MKAIEYNLGDAIIIKDKFLFYITKIEKLSNRIIFKIYSNAESIFPLKIYTYEFEDINKELHWKILKSKLSFNQFKELSQTYMTFT